MNNRPNKLTFIIFLTLFLLFLFLAFWMVSPYLLSVLMGGILAILSMPLQRRLMRNGTGRRLSSVLVTLILIIAVIGPIGTVSYLAAEQGIEFAQEITQQGSFDIEGLIDTVASWGPVASFIDSPEDLKAQIRTLIQSGGSAISGLLLSAISSLPDRILQGVLALLSCYFFLVDGPRFMAWINDKIPLDRDVRTHLYGSFQDTTISTIWATLAAASTQALIMFLGYLFLDTPGKFLAAAATFFFAWIPFIGSTPVWMTGAIILLTQDAYVRMVLMIAVGLVCGVSDNIVRPIVLKGRGGLHPLVSLVAIFGGIRMFGLFGVFFGPILAAVLLSLFQVWPVVARRFGMIRAGAEVPPQAVIPQGLRRELPGERTKAPSERGKRSRGSGSE